MKKDPSDRYQLASALKFDLNQISERVALLKQEHQGLDGMPMDKIIQGMEKWIWTPCSRDYYPYLCISDKPYGREAESKLILDAYSQWQAKKGDERKAMIMVISADDGAGRGSFVKYLSTFATTLGAFSGIFSINKSSCKSCSL